MRPESPQDRLAKQQREILFRYGGLGTELAGGIIGFVLLGWWIDRSLGTQPVWLVVLAVVGCVGGMYHLIQRAYQIRRRFEAAERAARKDEQRDDDSASPP